MAVEVTHIRVTNDVRHERISHFHWRDVATGSEDLSTKATMVDWVSDGGEAFVRSATGERVPIGIVTPPTGLRYLRTYANGTWNDDLLELPRF